LYTLKSLFSISHLIEMLFFLLFCHSFSFDPLSFDSGFMFWFFLWNVWFFFQFHPWINECYFPFISLFSIWSSFFIYIYILGPFINFFLFSSSNFEMLFFLFCFDFRFNSFSFNFGFLFWVPLWNVWFFQFHYWIYECYLPS
jgi:hypothetical protein